MMFSTNPARDIASAIDKVVSVPYTVSLQSLLETLRETSVAALEIWFDNKSCQLIALYQRLMQQACMGAYDMTYSILLNLCRQVSIRDMLIHHDNNLPASILQYFNSTKFFDGCLDFFRLPLPAGILAPIESIDFMRYALRNSQNQPQSQWLRNLRIVMQSFQSIDLSILGTEDGASAYIEWHSGLGSRDHECHLDFLCIASEVYRYFRQQELSRRKSSDEHLTSNLSIQQWSRAVISLFEGSQVSKTIRATLLRMLYFVSSGSKAGIPEAQEYMKTAESILHNIRPDLLSRVMQEQTSAEVVQRLVQKTFQPETPPPLQTSVCNILRMVDPQATNFSPSIILKLLVERLELEDLDEQFGMFELVSQMAFVIGCVFDSAEHLREENRKALKLALQSLLAYIFHVCEPETVATDDRIRSLSSTDAMLNMLENIVQKVPSVRELLVEASNNIYVPAWWFLTLRREAVSEQEKSRDSSNCKGFNVCPRTLEKRRKAAMRKFSFLLLRAACLSTVVMNETAYLRLSQHLACSKCQECQEQDCYWPKSATLTLQQLTDVKTVQNSNVEDWQTTLELELESARVTTQRHVLRAVERATWDLQHRCNEIETPLNEVKRKLYVAEQKLEEQLASAIAARAWYEEETHQWKKSADVWDHEKEVLNRKLHDMEQEQRAGIERENMLKEQLNNAREMQNGVLALLGHGVNEEMTA